MIRIVVTGAAGFIGANLIKGLNARGLTNIIAVDDLTQGDKFRNLADLQIADYVDAGDFTMPLLPTLTARLKPFFTRVPAVTPWKVTAST